MFITVTVDNHVAELPGFCVDVGPVDFGLEQMYGALTSRYDYFSLAISASRNSTRDIILTVLIWWVSNCVGRCCVN